MVNKIGCQRIYPVKSDHFLHKDTKIFLNMQTLTNFFFIFLQKNSFFTQIRQKRAG